MKLADLAAGKVTTLAAIEQDSALIAEIQLALKNAGYTPGKIDGIWGPLTLDAAKRFCINNHLNNFATEQFGKGFAATLLAAGQQNRVTRKTPDLTYKALAPEYQQLWDTMQIRGDRLQEAQRIMGKILGNRARYQAVALQSKNIPWRFIACLHLLEASLSFAGHLHNGDPLGARTVQVPVGRPIAGTPPFTWEESAYDALKLKGFDRVTDWSISSQLYLGEKFNGFGYRSFHEEVLTPYLWSGSNHYTKGKYVADGKFDANAVSEQIGVAVLLKVLGEN